MAAIFAFKCSSCDALHEGSPSFSFSEPHYYWQLTDAERSTHAELSDDTCVIKHEDRTDYFVRVLLEIPIHGVVDPFLWGVWVSLSEANYKRYMDTWNDADETDSYFGWFANRLPCYPNTLSLKTQVRPRCNGVRPYLELDVVDHRLCKDWRGGITIERVQEIAELMLHPAK